MKTNYRTLRLDHPRLIPHHLFFKSQWMLSCQKQRVSEKTSEVVVLQQLVWTSDRWDLSKMTPGSCCFYLMEQSNAIYFRDWLSKWIDQKLITPFPAFKVPPPQKKNFFLPHKKDKLYQISVIEHHLGKTETKFDERAPNFDEMVCSKSIWAYLYFTPLLSKVKKIPRDLAKLRMNETVYSASSANLAATDIKLI